MALNFNNIQIDEELEKLLPPLSKEDYNLLEQSLLKNGFEQKFGRIKVWFGSEEDTNNESVGYIVDGHNRYRICQKHKIEPVIGMLAYSTKEEVMEWMLDIQLGRRNLSPIQRISVAEKYRPIYEKQARENQSKAGGDKKSESQNSSKAVDPENKIDVRAKLAKTAGVSTDTYSKVKKILDSNNEELKQEVLSGEKKNQAIKFVV